MKVLILMFLLVSTITVSGQNLAPYFHGSKYLENPYGMCTHFTFSDDRHDEKTMSEQTQLIKQAGANIVRCDVYGGIVNDNNNAVLDKTLSVLKKNSLDFLAIAYDFRLTPKDNKWHSENKDFDKFLKTINSHYNKDKLHYIEFHNEVNFSKLSGLGQYYTKDLGKLNSLKKGNRALKILFSGIASSHYDFLDSAMSNMAYKYINIMNFHCYAVPEDLPNTMKVIHDNMTKYHWSKPVWITECGMSTAKPRPETTNYGFFNEVLPMALQKIGLKLSGLKIGVINDAAKDYCALNEYEVKMYITSKGAKCEYITFDELKQTSPKTVPVIVLTNGESFYSEYFPSVLEYVKKGGTIVLPYGTPFYYDSSNGNKITGKFYTNQLHVGQLYWWDAEAKRIGVPQYPIFNRANERFGTSYTYAFKNDGLHSARYLTDKLLKGKDKFTPICYAGNDKYIGVVAALYQLDSDLKGNVIIQTRVGVSRISDLEDEQARRVARIHIISFAYGIDKVFWYKFRSNEIDPYYSEDNFGMVHKDLSPKPAYYAYKTLIRMLPNGSLRPKLSLENGIYTAKWTKPNGQKVKALWCKKGNTYLPTDSNSYDYYDYMGNLITTKNDKIKITSGVIYAVKK